MDIREYLKLIYIFMHISVNEKKGKTYYEKRKDQSYHLERIFP